MDLFYQTYIAREDQIYQSMPRRNRFPVRWILRSWNLGWIGCAKGPILC